MKAKILKIDKKLFDGEVVKIVIPAETGEMCVLPHHMQIITPMKAGDIRIYAPNAVRPTVMRVNGGIFAFSDEVATVML